MMTMTIWTKMAVLQLATSVLGAVAGAWAYKED